MGWAPAFFTRGALWPEGVLPRRLLDGLPWPL